MILGIGIDLVNIKLFRDIIRDSGSVFIENHFTLTEIHYAVRNENYDSVLIYAGRYAAKEALIKALGPLFKANGYPEFEGGIDYRDIQIQTHSVSGAEIELYGRMKKIEEAFKVKKIFVSITHEENNAAAVVVLEGDF